MTVPQFTADVCVSSTTSDHYRATREQGGAAGLVEPAFSSSCVKECIEGNFDPGWCSCICSGRGVKHCGYGQ
jgi:hypothetical protein